MIKQGKVWGETRPLFNKNNVEMHLVHIKKDGFCSTHLHRTKYNKFIVIKGKLKVSIWKDYGTQILEDISILESGQECTVSPGDFHRFEALEDTEAFEIYWVELNEGDIVRKDHGGLKDEKKTEICRDEQNSGSRKESKNHSRSGSEEDHSCYCPTRAYSLSYL